MPFDIKRVYYLYDVPGGADRGGHAHKELEQLIVAISGSFDVVLDDGFEPDLIRSTPRIGISKAIEHPLRFVVEGNAFVSR